MKSCTSLYVGSLSWVGVTFMSRFIISRINGCIILAMSGLAMPPGLLLAQQGIAIMQSIMQFIGQAQHGLHAMHGFMQGSMHFIGQSAMAA